jgi:hypothetical protein
MGAASLKRAWRVVQGAAVVLFVCWNLLYLAVRNPLDLWWDNDTRTLAAEQTWWPKARWLLDDSDNNDQWSLNKATDRYGEFAGIQQGWSMFTPWLARKSFYLSAEMEFDNGDRDVVYSTNEFRHDTFYLRIGNWRQRKLEDDTLVRPNPDDLTRYRNEKRPKLVLWEAYVRHAVRRWQAAHPNDPRRIVAVRLQSHYIRFPDPNADTKYFEKSEPECFGVFDPDGRLR